MEMTTVSQDFLSLSLSTGCTDDFCCFLPVQKPNIWLSWGHVCSFALFSCTKDVWSWRRGKQEAQEVGVSCLSNTELWDSLEFCIPKAQINLTIFINGFGNIIYSVSETKALWTLKSDFFLSLLYQILNKVFLIKQQTPSTAETDLELPSLQNAGISGKLHHSLFRDLLLSWPVHFSGAAVSP